MKTQFTDLRECLVIDQFMKHLIGGSKHQWPPVGKSSDTPKEVKNARRDMITTAIIREASEYGAGCIYMQVCLPGYMFCYECTTSEASMKITHEIISQPETCIERYLCLECFVHEII